MLNQCHGYWLLSDALANEINLCVKLTSEIFQWEFEWIFEYTCSHVVFVFGSFWVIFTSFVF
jgi:hypothetical protein